MKTLLITKNILSKIKDKYYTCMAMLMLFMTGAAFAAPSAASDDPFPSITVKDGNVVNAVGSNMETSMKYAMIGGGIIMMLVGIGVIMHRLREDSANKDTGSFLTTLIISGLAITVGIILIAIGWGAASYNIPTS